MYPHTSSIAFVAAQATHTALAAYPASKPCVSKCSRRQVLHTVALSLITVALRPQAANAADAFGVGDAIPSDDFERVRASVKGDVTFPEFVALLQNGAVKRVWFFGTFNQYCCFEAADGVVRHVGDGYPVERSRSSESPLHVMAKIRDNKVPYYVAPLSAKYLRR